MRAAIGAGDFGSDSIEVAEAFYGTFDFIVEGWPAALAVKFVAASIKRCAAAFADVSAGLFVI